MGLNQFFQGLGSKLNAFLKARRIKSSLFSGTPVLQSISVLDGKPPNFSLVFKNGLMLTLGEAGILDYQDREFGSFIGGPGESTAPDNHEFLVQLHKIVLKSLLRYVIHPGLSAVERGRAAEAASKLWLASEGRDVTGRDYSMADQGSWKTGSPRESAPLY
ncbi:MAG: hypothetical protein JWP91_1921 [Fibrobacteres bacterium]|nr:hypothetical protein [Fibrobacterota bacterium]